MKKLIEVFAITITVILFAAMLGWMAVSLWGGPLVYAVVIDLLVVFGFAMSLFIILTWTPYIIRARRRGPINVPLRSIIDFATLAYLGSFVYGIRLWLTFTDGSALPASPGRAILSIAVWSLITIKVGLRTYVWVAALRSARPIDEVHEHVTGPTKVIDDAPR